MSNIDYSMSSVLMVTVTVTLLVTLLVNHFYVVMRVLNEMKGMDLNSPAFEAHRRLNTMSMVLVAMGVLLVTLAGLKMGKVLV